MKKIIRYSFILVLLGLLIPLASLARDIEPIVSTDWLEKNLNNPKLVIIDIRKVEDYKAGHIPKAINVIYGSWAVMKAGLRNELPPADDLSDVICAAGIGPESLVVLVGKSDPASRADIPRVAWTLKYAGIGNVAILDGGFDKWAAEKKALATDAVKPKATSYQAKANEGLFAKKDYVLGAIGKAVIIDVREPDFYQGKKKLEFVAKAGRIKGAINLPTVPAYTQEGTLFKSKADLAAQVTAAVGTDMTKEIILYCDSGRVCTAWAFIMSDLLGYPKIKVYDGSMEEWTKDSAAPVEP
jgi:thiosulfate/3-mercaptopyruvate sulfurtransferase